METTSLGVVRFPVGSILVSGFVATRNDVVVPKIDGEEEETLVPRMWQDDD